MKLGNPWRSGLYESFNGQLRDGLFYVEIFNTLQDMKIPVEHWHTRYDTSSPYSPPAVVHRHYRASIRWSYQPGLGNNEHRCALQRSVRYTGQVKIS